MKKKIIAITFICFVFVAAFANSTIKPETTKYPVEGKSSAVIAMTKIYSSDYWTEFYLSYEENKTTYDEAEAEKIIYEFISKYKVDKKFSTVEIEDLKDAATDKKTTKLLKRLIFKQVRK